MISFVLKITNLAPFSEHSFFESEVNESLFLLHLYPIIDDENYARMLLVVPYYKKNLYYV